ncbi:MAG TPA: cyclic nucleotide-binding domain-containing protein [Thermoanaerobaculia bacterium]|jgi:CRP-like cAMP-binding protein
MNTLFPIQSDHPLFRYFTDEERTRIERIGELRSVAAENYLITAGETDSTLYAIEDGHLDILAMRDGRSTVVATVGPGDVLGEVSFIDDSPRTVSVRAGEDAQVRVWDRKSLSEALAFEPQLLAKFAVAMCELLVERLRDTARRV